MAEPKEWSPKFDEQQIRGVIDQYTRFPDVFNDREDDIKSLEDHAYYYKIPFARNEKHQEAFVSRMLKQAGKGFVEGFTTLPPEKLGVGSEPQDTYEGIARNLGHLAGFVGYLPGGSALRKLGILKTYSRVAQGIRGKSVPMMGANLVEKKVKSAIAPMLDDLPQWAQSGVVPDMVQGAFHLGTASAISSVFHGVDEMFKAAGFGAVAGGAFRGIGNLPGFGKRLEASQMKPNGRPDISKLEPGQRADLVMRTMSASALQGLPSTLQGATTEEQIYQYALGAFFGFGEIPYQTRTSRQYLAESIKEKYGPDPELNPRWDTLTKEMKNIVRRDFKETFQYDADGPSESSFVIFDILSNRGMDLKQIERIAEEYGRAYEVDTVTGEVVAGLSPREVKQYKQEYVRATKSDDTQDLDMHIGEIMEVPGRIIGKNGLVDRLYGKDPENPLSLAERVKRSNEIYKQWDKLQNEDSKPIPGAEQKIIDFIEKTYGKQLDDNFRGEFRRWAETKRKQKWVEQIEVNGNKVRVLQQKTNTLGNTKDLSQEPLIIEDAYRLEYAQNKMKKPIVEEEFQFFRVLDHIIYKGKEHDLSRATKGIAKQKILEVKRAFKKRGEEIPEWKELNKLAEGEAVKFMNDTRVRVFELMKKQGYYYYGGKGDNKKQYFVKMHPRLEKNKKFQDTVKAKLFSALRKAGQKDARKAYREAREEWLKEYPVKNGRKEYDRIYASNVLYDLTINGFSTATKDLAKGIEKVLSKGFINDPKGFNKRQQIWFNTGYSANPKNVTDIIRNKMIEAGKTPDLSSTDLGFKVGLFNEASGKKKHNLRDVAEEYAEISDGAIIAREEVVDALNIDKGLPSEGKMNKSFIVSPDPKYGTLLGKYAIHIASPEMQKMMEDKGIHMLMPFSAAKQTGGRNQLAGDLQYISRRGKFSIDYDGTAFDVPINHFRTIMSEITASKMIKRQQVPKQMYSVLSQYGYKSIDPKVMEDMYKSLSDRAIRGTLEGSKLLAEYNKNPNATNLDNIVNNIDRIPLQEVFYILRDPKKAKLAQKLYEQILKTNNEHIEGLAEEGELSRKEVAEARETFKDYEGVMERMARIFPDGSIGAYMHKFSRDYRMQALRNYVVNRLTRPKIDNSASSRMRPYEAGLQIPNKNTAILSKKEGQDVFFLDEGFRDLMIYDSSLPKGKIKLGELWDTRNTSKFKNFKEQVDDILTAVVMRVPMDSISGAHGLKFAGFTGIKGYGSLLHPRTMRALGGADLDGDKAFVFFGGESSGFKKSWRQMYESAKDEYVDSKGFEKHNKDAMDPKVKQTYREQLAEMDPALMEKAYKLSSQYSPYWREYMSKGAYEGRDYLGIGVTRRMAILGAYNSIRGHNIKESSREPIVINYMEKGERKQETDYIVLTKDRYSVPYRESDGKGNSYKKRIVFEVRKNDIDLQRFREMSRAAIALGSDPMDEAGIKGNLFEPKMLGTLFKYKVFDVNKNGGLDFNKVQTGLVNNGRMDYLLNHSLHKKFLEANSALYGKNHFAGRRYTYSEIQEALKTFDFMPEIAKNSFLPQLAESMKGINWSDNVFRHVNEAVLNKIYFDHADLVRENEWLRDVMGRKTLATDMGLFIKKTLDGQIYTREGRERIAGSEKRFTEYIKDMGKMPRNFRNTDFSIESNRRFYLEHLALKAEDFLVNDLSDMASLKSITDVINAGDIPAQRISDIHSKVDEIKSKTVYMAKKRRAIDETLRRIGDIEHVRIVEGENGLESIPIAKTLNQKARDAIKNFGFDDKVGTANDRVKTDKDIRDYKARLSDPEKDLFDMLYIGTYSKGNPKLLKTLETLQKDVTKLNYPELQNDIEKLRQLSMNTSLIREGVNSNEISDGNLKKFFSNYEQLIKKSRVELNEAQKEQLRKEVEGEEPVTTFKDNKGNDIKGEFIDMGLIDAETKTYLDEVRPFTKLFKGEVKDPELRRVYDSLMEHMEHYHNLDVVNLNGFFRGIFKKNINEATKVDLQQLDRVFKDMRDGTWWRETMDFMTGKDKNPEIKKAYYWMFPKAIERDLMRNPAMMEWVEDVGPYKDKLGNTFENARTVRPTTVIGTIQQLAHRTQELSMQKFEDEQAKWRDELRPYVSALKDGDTLFEIAVARREWRYAKDKLRKRYKDTSSDLTSKEMPYYENWNAAEKKFNLLKGKKYLVPTERGTIERTGEDIVNSIDNIITRNNQRTRKWLTGTEEGNKKWMSMAEENGTVTWKGLDRLRKNFHKYLMDTVQKNAELPIEELGIDGMRQVVKRILISQTPKRLRTNKELAKARESLEVTPFDVTGDLGPEYYFPHMTFNRKSAKNKLKKALDKIVNDPELTPDQVAKESKKLIHQFKKMTGDFMTKDEMGDNFDTMQEVMTQMANNKANKAKSILTNDLKRVGNQFSRDAHIGGWELTPEAYESYMRNSINTFYKQAMQLSARTSMYNFNNSFYTKTKDAGLTNSWMNFFKLYTQSAMGYPTHIPEAVMNDPRMKIKGTAYKWLADSTAKKRLDYIRKKLGINRRELERFNLDEKSIDELSGVEYSQLQGWGALEAKWQLASLLAHPKSSIANLYGGTVHTWISTGYENLKNARNFEYLKTTVNPKWNNMKDVERWLQSKGIIEEFLVHEAGLNPQLKTKKNQEFVRSAIQKIKRDPNFSDESLAQLARKNGITDRAFAAASSFMRVPERILRRDSFMAHYLQARENFGGAIKDYDSPFLINYAKRGVKGTQFLYSAPFRPLFTNSTLGRVFSRFQLWSWNSVRFRNDVLRRAKIAGYREGTPEYEAFERLAMADLFMLGMSNLFMYSLFESSLPAPWNWFQDTADYLMGSEKERERAFFGSPIGPLQAITPPSLRLLPPMFKWMVSGDSARLTDYYLWTIPPFGRIIRDVVGPGGIIENPFYTVTKFTGLPLMQTGQLIKQDNPEEARRGRFIY